MVKRYSRNSSVVPYFSENLPLYLINNHFPKNSQDPVSYKHPLPIPYRHPFPVPYNAPLYQFMRESHVNLSVFKFTFFFKALEYILVNKGVFIKFFDNLK